MADDNQFSSFDENDWKAQNAADDREIAKLLEQSQDGASGGLKLDDTPFDQTNKADDAEDFEDISDDDLPEEEPSASTSVELPGLTDDGETSNNDADDLFGEGPSSPTDPVLGPPSPAPHVRDADAADETQPSQPSPIFPGINFDPEPRLTANQDPDIPAPAETVEDLLKAAWPAYKKGCILTWSELLPAKKAIWKEKKPLKKPKRLVTSKLTLELDQDSVTHFRLPGPPATSRTEGNDHKGLVFCYDDTVEEEENIAQFDIDQVDESETVMGFTLRDIEMACEDWYTQIGVIEKDFAVLEAEERKEATSRKRLFEEEDDDEWNAEFLMDDVVDTPAPPRSAKRSNLASQTSHDILPHPSIISKKLLDEVPNECSLTQPIPTFSLILKNLNELLSAPVKTDLKGSMFRVGRSVAICFRDLICPTMTHTNCSKKTTRARCVRHSATFPWNTVCLPSSSLGHTTKSNFLAQRTSTIAHVSDTRSLLASPSGLKSQPISGGKKCARRYQRSSRTPSRLVSATILQLFCLNIVNLDLGYSTISGWVASLSTITVGRTPKTTNSSRNESLGNIACCYPKTDRHSRCLEPLTLVRRFLLSITRCIELQYSNTLLEIRIFS
uniref:Uncharacterized protein n=1 Tax=Bionectria ochroleuca TaxID=29856 RepID=A0A8H7NME6_BIOOC